jgi:hypothetical protein
VKLVECNRCTPLQLAIPVYTGCIVFGVATFSLEQAGISVPCSEAHTSIQGDQNVCAPDDYSTKTPKIV